MQRKQQSQPKPEKFKCWEYQGEHLKKDCPKLKFSHGKPKHHRFEENKEKECKLLKSFQKKIFNKKESINELMDTSEDDETLQEKWNQFFGVV